MIYKYECPEHGEFDVAMPVEKMKAEYECPHCDRMCPKIITGAAIRCDSEVNVPWLNSACRTLLPDDHKPLETRGEYKRYLRDHGIVERA